MGIERKAVVFYRNFYEAMKDLPVELKAEVFDAVMEYGLNGEEPSSLSIMAKSLFALIKPSIDTNNIRYKNGKEGGRPKKNEQKSDNDVETKEKPKENQIETKQEPNNNINNEYVYENINDNNIHTEEELPLLVPEVVTERIDYSGIVRRYNEVLGKFLPKVTIISEARRNAIKSIHNKHGTDAIELVFQKVYNSAFIRGEIEKGKKWCSFDWVLKSSNFIKILEGNYDGNDRTTNFTEKERANQAALDQFMSNYNGRQDMVEQVEKPF